jgi:hypothetical protein
VITLITGPLQNNNRHVLRAGTGGIREQSKAKDTETAKEAGTNGKSVDGTVTNRKKG